MYLFSFVETPRKFIIKFYYLLNLKWLLKKLGCLKAILSLSLENLLGLQNVLRIYIFTPPARRAWRSFKFVPFLFFFAPSRKSGYRCTVSESRATAVR